MIARYPTHCFFALLLLFLPGVSAGAVAGASLQATSPGVRLTVFGTSLAERYGDIAARDGHRFLVVDAEFANVISADLVFRHDVLQRIELASLRRKVFLHWDGRTICRLAEERQREAGHVPNDAVLARHGSKVRGVLVFEVPSTTMKAATLLAFHDGFGPLEIALGDGAADPLTPTKEMAKNQALDLAVTKFVTTDTWRGRTAPPGQTFAVVHLAGEGGFPWTTRAVMLDAAAAAPDAAATFRLPFEYFEARLALNLVVDGDVAVAWDAELSEAGETPVFLPGRWAETILVYAVPREARSLALEALFGRMGLGYERGEVLSPLRLPLQGTAPDPVVPEDAVQFVDEKDGYRFGVSLSELATAASVHGTSAGEGERFLTATVRVDYDGPEPGRDALARRFFLLLPGGLPQAIDEATFAGALAPLPELSFAPGTRRRFELVFAVPTALDRTTLNFSGPGGVHQVPLAFTAEGVMVAGPVTSLTSLEIESRALVKRADDGQLTAAAELASDVRRPRPENIKAEWQPRWALQRDNPAAELVVRVGDIDNFGFGWPDGYDPFSGETLKSHPYPWPPDPRDPPGTDRIMVGTSYEGRGSFDGYTSGTKRPLNTVQDIVFSFAPGGLTIESATLRMFLDDFQAAKLGSRFQCTIDGVRQPMIEEVLNALSQTGPVGKLVTVMVPAESLALLADGAVALRFDDPETGVGDGFAVDFVELLLNPRQEVARGTIRGVVREAESGQPVAGALLSAAGLVDVESGADGTFALEEIPAGLAVVTASLSGYRTATASRDLPPGAAETVEFVLARETAGETLRKEGRVVVRGVRFASDSALLEAESEEVLRELLAVLVEKKASRFRIEGHTDAEGGDDYNLTLSRQRATAVVAWFAQQGIAAERMQADGYGETRPVASNASPTGRALNRRVEIRELRD